jgi:hypothetical protein
VDTAGNVYVADQWNGLIRKITSNGMVSTLSGTNGPSNGSNVSNTFASPGGVAVDVSGNVYVADTFNEIIRKIQIP